MKKYDENRILLDQSGHNMKDTLGEKLNVRRFKLGACRSNLGI